MRYDSAAYYLRFGARVLRRCAEAVATELEMQADTLHKFGWPYAKELGLDSIDLDAPLKGDTDGNEE